MKKTKNQNNTVEFKKVIPSMPVKLKPNSAVSTNQSPWKPKRTCKWTKPGTALYFSIHCIICAWYPKVSGWMIVQLLMTKINSKQADNRMIEKKWRSCNSFFSASKNAGESFLKNNTRQGMINKNCTHHSPNQMNNERVPAITVMAERPVIQLILKWGSCDSFRVIFFMNWRKRMPHIQLRNEI